MQLKRHIPNLFTLTNLFCGSLAIIYLLREGLSAPTILFVAFAVCVALICDFLDGFAARSLKVDSKLGLQLDSLADMVTFGLLPGIILFLCIQHVGHDTIWSVSGLIVTLFSALRLAKFNIDERQSEGFIGLPTPANAILILALAMTMLSLETSMSLQGFLGDSFKDGLFGFLRYPAFWILFSFLSSFLLNAELPLLALKFKDFSWNNNQSRFILILISILFILFLGFKGIPFIIIFYFIISILENRKTSK